LKCAEIVVSPTLR